MSTDVYIRGVRYIRADLVAERDAEIERMRDLVDTLRQQAESWAQEARTHKATVHEIYQAVTGATGEPGNWHGAQPVIAEIERLRSDNATLRGQIETANRVYGDECRQLRSDNATLRETVGELHERLRDMSRDDEYGAHRIIAELRSDNASLRAMRADAERYRWLTTNTIRRVNAHKGWHWTCSVYSADGLQVDAAIDAAIAALRGEKP